MQEAWVRSPGREVPLEKEMRNALAEPRVSEGTNDEQQGNDITCPVDVLVSPSPSGTDQGSSLPRKGSPSFALWYN